MAEKRRRVETGLGSTADITIWGCTCWNGVGTFATKYQEILDEHLWPAIA